MIDDVVRTQIVLGAVNAAAARLAAHLNGLFCNPRLIGGAQSEGVNVRSPRSS